MRFLTPRFCSAAAPSRCRSCCTCCGATSRRTCRSPRCACCEARRSIDRGAGGCATCCCSPRASPRCCCWRPRSRGRTSPDRQRRRRDRRIVAVDRSFSMGAPGRFERARELARQAVADAGNDRVALVAFDERADVVAPRWDGGGRARGHRPDRRAGFAGTRYGAVFDKATELLARRLAAGWSSSPTCSAAASTAASPPSPDNVELDRAGRRRRGRKPGGDRRPRRGEAGRRDDPQRRRRTRASSRHGSKSPVKSGRSRPVSVGAIARLTSPSTAPHRSVRSPLPIDDAEGYAADNIRYSVNAAERCRACSSSAAVDGSGDGFYLSRGLQAGGDEGSDFDVKLVSGSAFAAMSPDDITRQSAMVLLSTHGVDRRAREPLRSFFEAGGGLFIAAATDVDGSVLSTALDWTAAVEAARAAAPAACWRRPTCAIRSSGRSRRIAANLGQVTFERAWEVDPAEDWRVRGAFYRRGAALLERTARTRTHPALHLGSRSAMERLSAALRVRAVRAGIAPLPRRPSADERVRARVGRTIRGSGEAWRGRWRRPVDRGQRRSAGESRSTASVPRSLAG